MTFRIVLLGDLNRSVHISLNDLPPPFISSSRQFEGQRKQMLPRQRGRLKSLNQKEYVNRANSFPSRNARRYSLLCAAATTRLRIAQRSHRDARVAAVIAPYRATSRSRLLACLT